MFDWLFNPKTLFWLLVFGNRNPQKEEKDEDEAVGDDYIDDDYYGYDDDFYFDADEEIDDPWGDEY